MPGTAHCGGVWEVADAVHLQRAALDLQEPGLPGALHVEVQTGFSITVFRTDNVKTAGLQPLGSHAIRSRTVNVKKHTILLADCDEVIAGLAVRIGGGTQVDLGTRHKEFPIPPGVFDVNGLGMAVPFHVGDKPVRTVQEHGTGHVFILHE